ncbi:MAG: DUF3138 domain-containing protein [Rhodocyclaceae bacterium]|nr:MAG: DUF3138 domain-containing protein [Rhodocyclaceae bacterium]
MNRQFKSAIGVGLIAMAGGAAAAQPTADELLKQIQALRATVESLQKQVKDQSESLAKTKEALPTGVEYATTTDLDGLKSDLEDYKYSVARDRQYNTALSTRGVTIGGTLTGSYTASTLPSAATSNRPYGTPAENSFNASATLSFAGNLYKDYDEGRNWDYKLGLSLANPKFANGAASTNSPAPGDSVIKLTDVYLQYSLVKSNGGLEDPKLTVTFGQQKIPFGLEAQVSDELKPTVSTAQFLGTSALSQLGKRQIGVVLRGDWNPTVDYGFNYRAPLIEYAIGVVNGNGDNTADDNTRKDWLGRVAFTLPVDYNSPFRELKFGASYYSGWKVLTNTANNVVADAAHSSRKGIDIYYNHNPIGVTYERADGVDDALLVPAAANYRGTQPIKSSGQVLTVFYNFGDIAQWSKNLNQVGKYDDFWPTTSQVYYRFDRWDPNVYAAKDEIFKGTVGYNYFFAQTTKLQLGFTRTTYPNGSGKTSASDLTALFQYGF